MNTAAYKLLETIWQHSNAAQRRRVDYFLSEINAAQELLSYQFVERVTTRIYITHDAMTLNAQFEKFYNDYLFDVPLDNFIGQRGGRRWGAAWQMALNRWKKRKPFFIFTDDEVKTWWKQKLQCQDKAKH